MTNVLFLIAALQALHVHGNKVKCNDLSNALIKVAVHDAFDPNEKEKHFSADLFAINGFYEGCVKK